MWKLAHILLLKIRAWWDYLWAPTCYIYYSPFLTFLSRSYISLFWLKTISLISPWRVHLGGVESYLAPYGSPDLQLLCVSHPCGDHKASFKGCLPVGWRVLSGNKKNKKIENTPCDRILGTVCRWDQKARITLWKREMLCSSASMCEEGRYSAASTRERGLATNYISRFGDFFTSLHWPLCRSWKVLISNSQCPIYFWSSALFRVLAGVVYCY
jgi:hypothetical protein